MLEFVIALLIFIGLVYIRHTAVKHAEEVENAIKIGRVQGYNQAFEERQEANRVSEQIRRDAFLHKGARVISISNEWQDICVGEISEMSQVGNSDSYVPIVRDVLTGEEMCCFGVVIPYTPEILRAVNKLNPFERYSLAISSRMYDVNQYIFHKNKTYSDEVVELTSSEEVEKKLQAIGWL